MRGLLHTLSLLEQVRRKVKSYCISKARRTGIFSHIHREMCKVYSPKMFVFTVMER